MLDLTQSWDDIAAFLSLLAEVLRPGGDVAEVLGPGDDEAAFLGRVCAGENHGEGSPLVFAPENCEAPFRRGDYLARKRLGFHSLLAEVLGPGDDEAAFLSLLARVLGPGDDEAAFLSLLARVLGPGDDEAAFLSLLAEVLRPGGDVAEVLGPGDDEAAFLGRVCAGENHGEGSPLVFAPENCEAPFRRGDYLARKRLGFHSLLAEVLGPGDDEAAFLSLLARVLGPGDDDDVALLSLLAEVPRPVVAEEKHVVAAPDLPKPFNLADYFAQDSTAFHSLLAEVLGPGDDEAAFLSLLARVLGPGDDEAAFLSLLARVLGPGDDEAAFLSLLKVGVLCHDIVAAHAQCKDEASEYTGFEGHGNADTPELKSVPDWLEEKLAKTATEEHKDAEK